MLRRLCHRLAHFLGWNLGTVATEWRDDGRLWVGFRCSSCGLVDNWAPAAERLLP